MGVALITSGAFGNLTDRLRIHKVVDFIDWEFPNIAIDPFSFLGIQFGGLYMDRWPTFNIADALVCVGVSIIFAVSFSKKKEAPVIPNSNDDEVTDPEPTTKN